MYSSTRYEGALKFPGLADLDFSNIAISKIQLQLTFAKSGGSSNKYLYFYQATQNSISGSISSMRGDEIGTLYVENAYNRTTTLTFDTATNAELFHSFCDYFSTGNQVMILYAPKTRGTYSGGYCYDYLSITAATLTFTYDYLQSEGYLSSTSVTAGSAAKLNIICYNSEYTHNVTWTFGSHSSTQTVAAGSTSASFPIPLSWLDAIPSTTSGSATVQLETLDMTGNPLGVYSYHFTITVPESVAPTISSITATPINTNAVLNGWSIYAYGMSQAKLSIVGASGVYGSTIRSYSITTSPSIGNSSEPTFTTGTLYSTGTITVTATIIDTRGRSTSKSTTFYVHPYSPPSFGDIESYRCNSDSVQDDTAGTYALINAKYACSPLNGSNTVSCRAVLNQVGGSYSTSSALPNGTSIILGNGELAIDAVYAFQLTLTDALGIVSTYTADIGSAAYVMHVKKGGKAVGFGMAAGDDETISFGWAVKMHNPLALAEGGTGADNSVDACNNIGALPNTGGTLTGDLTVQGALYPSLLLRPTYNSTTNRTVFEGSYLGAASFAAWEDATGNNRRMLEVRTAAYAPSLDNAILLRTAINGTFYSHRIFHSGMATPVPLGNGGTAATNAVAARSNLGAAKNLNYSTSEINTERTWIDGKSLYRKTITTTDSSTGYVDIDLSDLGFDFIQIVDSPIHFKYNNSGEYWGPTSWHNQSAGSGAYDFHRVYISGTLLRLHTGSRVNRIAEYTTIEYTKA